MKHRGLWSFLCVLALLIIAAWVSAADVNTNLIGNNGWFSDDTRADGSGTQPEGTNLISDTLTDDPEATASGSSAHDTDILAQAIFALITDPGTEITTVQFGVGSFNQGASVWVNQLETSFYRPGDRTTFGGPVPVELMTFTVE